MNQLAAVYNFIFDTNVLHYLDVGIDVFFRIVSGDLHGNQLKVAVQDKNRSGCIFLGLLISFLDNLEEFLCHLNHRSFLIALWIELGAVVVIFLVHGMLVSIEIFVYFYGLVKESTACINIFLSEVVLCDLNLTVGPEIVILSAHTISEQVKCLKQLLIWLLKAKLGCPQALQKLQLRYLNAHLLLHRLIERPPVDN